VKKATITDSADLIMEPYSKPAPSGERFDEVYSSRLATGQRFDKAYSSRAAATTDTEHESSASEDEQSEEEDWDKRIRERYESALLEQTDYEAPKLIGAGTGDTSAYLLECAKNAIEVCARLVQTYHSRYTTGVPPVSTEVKQELVKTVVCLLRGFVMEHPEYDSKPGLCDADADQESGFHAMLETFFAEQPGFEAIVQYNQEPDVVAKRETRQETLQSNQTLVDADGVKDFATQFLDAAAQYDPLLVDEFEGFREGCFDHLVSVMTSFVLEHGFNSHRGVDKLRHNTAFQKLCEAACIEFQTAFYDKLQAEGKIARRAHGTEN